MVLQICLCPMTNPLDSFTLHQYVALKVTSKFVFNWGRKGPTSSTSRYVTKISLSLGFQ
jgi:hypothetical protein